MVCTIFRPIYAPHSQGGCNVAKSSTDGYEICLTWDKAYPGSFGNKIAYNIYFSTVRNDIFTEGVKFVSIDDEFLSGCLIDMPPGQLFYFVVRATEYIPDWYDLSLLPNAHDGLKIYPEGILLSNINDVDLEIPVSDIEQWPSFGVIQIGTELIRYSTKDTLNNLLIAVERGFLESNIRFHNIDGYDGVAFQSTIIKFFKGFEDDNERVQIETSTFFEPNYAFTKLDGYATNTDKITTDLTSSDEELIDFREFDFVGWHRTDPRLLVKGKCLGSYIGGEAFCADGYEGVGRQIRNISFSEQAIRREEVLLRTTGQPFVLVKRLWSGIRCPCVLITNEQPEKRCSRCFGTGFVTGYEQFFNPRRSDGRILMRPGPYPDNLKFLEAGLESDSILELWTLPVPAIKVKDFLIRYHRDGTEEFRYEVIDVQRNVLFDEVLGVQKIRAQRVRRTSPIYQWKAIANTATMPTKLATSIGMLVGSGGAVLPHTHEVVVNENITSISQINQTTSVTEGHNHEIRNGIVQESVGHTHQIIII